LKIRGFLRYRRRWHRRSLIDEIVEAEFLLWAAKSATETSASVNSQYAETVGVLFLFLQREVWRVDMAQCAPYYLAHFRQTVSILQFHSGCYHLILGDQAWTKQAEKFSK
jgi:hypothetical protein